MKLLLTAIILMLSLPSVAGNPSLNGEHFVCTSEDAHDQMYKSFSDGDQLAFDYLQRSGKCFNPVAGTPVSIIDFGITYSQVRAYTSYGPVDMFVVTEGLNIN